MTRMIPFLLAVLPGAAWAHVGHFGDVAGHDHWVAGAALGAAALAALWAAWKGRGEPAPDKEGAEKAPDEEGASA